MEFVKKMKINKVLPYVSYSYKDYVCNLFLIYKVTLFFKKIDI